MRRGPLWWVFGVLAAVLVARNWALFTKPIYEEGDAAANSVLVDNAKGFTQLVGNYSRVGFHHPGPAFLYVQAFGEWLFHDVLGLVPSEWNGQALAILLLNALLVALAVTIVGRSFRAPDATPGSFGWVEAAVAATALIFLASWDDLVTSTWPPFEYFAPYLLLLAAATSVASGGVRDLWALCLAGGLLVHGHAEFLFLATILALGAVVALLWPHRRTLRGYVTSNRRHFLIGLAVVLVALSPIAIDLALHWPGEFAKYFGYGGERPANPLGPAAWYVIREWDMDQWLAIPVFVGYLVALALAASRSRHPYARWALVATGLGLVTVLLYTVVGVDSLSQPYILFFTRAFPMFALMVAVAVVVRSGPWRRGLTRGLVAGAVLLGLFSPALVNRQVTVNDAPAALAALPHDRPVVLHVVSYPSWAEALPLALEGQRNGVRICLVNPDIEMMATSAFMCRPDELDTGHHFTVARAGQEPPDLTPVIPLAPSVILR